MGGRGKGLEVADGRDAVANFVWRVEKFRVSETLSLSVITGIFSCSVCMRV